MIDTSAAYKAAIKAPFRRILARVTLDLIDPDLVYGAVTGSEQSYLSQPEQLHDRVFALGGQTVTLEHNRWLLDGSFGLPPLSPSGETGFETATVLGTSAWAQIAFSDVDVLNECTIIFTDRLMDGLPTAIKVDVYQGQTVSYSTTVTEITGSRVTISGFTVYLPTAIRVTVNGWSLPDRLVRIVEIIPGIIETYETTRLADLSITQQTDLSMLTLPYSTCSLTFDNSDRRFDWRNRNGAFNSLEERQDVVIKLGVSTDGGNIMLPAGVYYLNSGGWRSSDNGLTLKWSLIDIIGLIAQRKFIPPTPLPTTFEGWIASIISPIGAVFSNRWTIDEAYASLELTCHAYQVADVTCGALLMWLCQATSTWPKADPETGNLVIEPIEAVGVSLELTQLAQYPTIADNADINSITFVIDDETQYTFSGTSTSSPTSRTVQNPFIKNRDAALAASRTILTGFGGLKIETVGRGDFSSELGDAATVWLDNEQARAGRVIKQTFGFQNGVLQNCRTTLIAAAGIELYENSAIFTAAGTFTVPEGVTELRVILVGKGANGGHGKDGTWYNRGADGANGAGGKVWASTISVNPGDSYAITIATETTFGLHSSADGLRYPDGYVDIVRGITYARTGIYNAVQGSGDGGEGGVGGDQGLRHQETGYYYTTEIVTNPDGTISFVPIKNYVTVMKVDQYPGDGEAGTPGATGSAIIYWEVPEVES